MPDVAPRTYSAADKGRLWRFPHHFPKDIQIFTNEGVLTGYELNVRVQATPTPLAITSLVVETLAR
jgi:hypothetical protein